jgi:hypothetical protein
MCNCYTLRLAIGSAREGRQDAPEKSHWTDPTLRLDSILLIFAKAFYGVPSPARRSIYAKGGGSALIGMYATIRIQQVRSAAEIDECKRSSLFWSSGLKGAKLDSKDGFGRSGATKRELLSDLRSSSIKSLASWIHQLKDASIGPQLQPIEDWCPPNRRPLSQDCSSHHTCPRPSIEARALHETLDTF